VTGILPAQVMHIRVRGGVQESEHDQNNGHKLLKTSNQRERAEASYLREHPLLFSEW